MSYQLLQGDCIEVMRTLPAESVQVCVTSPPYYGLRDYGTAQWEGGHPECQHSISNRDADPLAVFDERVTRGKRDRCLKCGARRIDRQIGLEETPEQFVAKLVEVFREVRRVLHPSGTLWLNIGDSYNGSGGAGGDYGVGGLKEGQPKYPGRRIDSLKPKDLIGIPWMVAFALRADGWWLRADVIWAKPNPMPESVTDRPTKAHEYLFLLSKNSSYFYDAESIREPAVYGENRATFLGGTDRLSRANIVKGGYAPPDKGLDRPETTSRNKRSVWTITTEAYPESHFATYPTKLVEPCILAGTSAKGCCAKCGAPWERNIERLANYEKRQDRGQPNGKPAMVDSSGWKPATVIDNGWQPTCTCGADVVPCAVLDPFNGSGTTGAVALKHHRNYIGIDLNPAYIELAHDRIRRSQPMLLEVQP